MDLPPQNQPRSTALLTAGSTGHPRHSRAATAPGDGGDAKGGIPAHPGDASQPSPPQTAAALLSQGPSPLTVPKSQPFRGGSSSSGAVAAPRALPAHFPVSPGTFVVSAFVFSASRRHLEKQHSRVFSQYFLPPRDLRSYKWTKTCVILTSEDFKSLQKNMSIVKKA